MTATEAVRMQLSKVVKSEDAFKCGKEDAAKADVIFEGLEQDEEFKLFALAHADLINLDPVRVAISLLYCGYMAAKMEAQND